MGLCGFSRARARLAQANPDAIKVTARGAGVIVTLPDLRDIKIQPSDIENKYCPYCDKNFRSKYALQMHAASKHNDIFDI